jgi:tetratricopeptide (TPR) repeat protein
MRWSWSQQRLTLFCLAALLAGAGSLWWLAVRSSSIHFLPARTPAEWILYPTPADGPGFDPVELAAEFQRSFNLSAAPQAVTLSVRALKRCEVFINGKPAGPSAPARQNWKQPAIYDVTGLLTTGTNQISVKVFNNAGLPALWLSLSGDKLTLATDERWQASFAGSAWRPAQLASRPLPIMKGNPLYEGEHTIASLRARWPQFLGFILLTGMVVVGCQRLGAGRKQGLQTSMSTSRQGWLVVCVLAAAWAILWGNNLGHLPMLEGFDIAQHLDYIDYILKRRALPLANEGFQMYQPPLYYLLSAGQLALFHLSPYEANGIFVLRLFGLACGIVIFTLVFLSLRLLFPDRPHRQFFGLLLAGLLPWNLYLCQYITNEILVTALVAAAVYCCLRILVSSQVSLRAHAVLGLLWGAALLAKTSAVVVPPLGFAALVWNLHSKGIRSARKWAAFLGVALFCCLVVCGWHYARVTAHFGNPLIGNWDPRTGFHWWQQQSFRTGSYYRFSGSSLAQPFYSAFGSFGDGVYSTLWGDGLYGGETEFETRPPWNYDLMAAGYLFALVPTLAIIAGAGILLIQFIRQPRPEMFLLLGLAFLLGWLLIYYSLKVPSYAATKAFYASGALISLCAFGAIGWDWLVTRTKWLKFALYLGLGLWAMNSYTSFWIRPDATHTQVLIARGFASQGRHDLAVLKLAHTLSQNPHDAPAARLLSLELVQLGQLDAARNVAEQTLRWAEGNADCHLALGAVLARQKQWDPAAAQARRAMELAPDHLLGSQRLAEWLEQAGRRKEALVACRDALRINPTQVKLHFLLGSGLASEGQASAAIEAYRTALRLDSNFAPALDALARILATHPDPKLRNGAEAVLLATRACEANASKNAAYLETLAAAYAETGRFAEAISTAQKAISVARATNDEQHALLGEKLLALFQAGRPFRAAE